MEPKIGVDEQIKQIKPEVEQLLRYLPWLKEKSGISMHTTFKGEGIAEHSLAFPVYDGTLMAFVKEASRLSMMNRNYPYIYSWNRIRTVDDEKRIIANATIRALDVLCGIFSHYILGGMTKTALWSTGMEQGIYLELLQKMKTLLDFWDKPLA